MLSVTGRSTGSTVPSRNGRAVTGCPEPLGGAERVFRAAWVQHEQEFLAAVATEAVSLSRGGLESADDLAQHFVAGRMPERIVDRLEVIDVAQQDAQRQPGALRQLQLSVQRFRHEGAIEGAGETVSRRLVFEHLQGLAARLDTHQATGQLTAQ